MKPRAVLAAAVSATTAVAFSSAVAVFAALPGWEPDRKLTRSAAESMTSINFARSVAVDEAGRVHVVWIEQTEGGAELFYKRSIDAGVSWGPPVRLLASLAQAFNPSVAAAGGLVVVAWQDNRPGQSLVHVRRSSDGGVHWWSEQALTSDGAGSPSVAIDGRAVHVVYGRPLGPADTDIFYRRSLDGGVTWHEEVRISDLPGNSWVPTVAVDGADVYLAWADTTHSPEPCCLEEEYFARSADGGATWSTPLRLTFDSPGAPANSWAPSLAADGANVTIVWFDERSGGWEIYAKRSQDRGVTWTADSRLTDSSGSAVRPSIARRGSELFVAYWDNPPGEAEEIYLLRSADLGATWEEPQRLTAAPGSSILASIAAGAYGVHVVWTDGRDGNREVYHSRLPGEAVEIGNGLIAFGRRVEGVSQLFTVRPDGTGERQLTFDGENLHPAWSKDGSRLLFTSTRAGSPNLWIMEPDGSNAARLTDGGSDFVADWSFDGTRIAAASIRDVAQVPDIWIANADGTGPTRLTLAPEGTSGSVHPTFAPGDGAIYFASGATGSMQVWGMLPDGQGAEQKTNGLGPGSPEANAPDWSRDGVLAFWSGFEGQFGEVWRWDLPGSAPRQLTETADPSSSDNPAWSPDGATILFDSNRGGGVALWAMAADGSNPRRVVPGAEGPSSWQPVGTGDDEGGGGSGDGEPFVCMPGERVRCLHDGRFEVRVEWRDFAGDSGLGTVASAGTDDSALFWFFDEANWELLLKVVDGCSSNGHYWIFAAATTNVAYEITVTDSATGEPLVFENPLGVRAPAIAEIEAFASCP